MVNCPVFRETMRNVGEPNFQLTKKVFRKIIGNRNEKKAKVVMNKPVYLGLS